MRFPLESEALVSDMAGRLRGLGYPVPLDMKTVGWEEAFRAYIELFQRMRDLPVTGELTAATVRELRGDRFCGVADFLPLSDGLSKWPENRVLWTIRRDATWRGLSRDRVLQACEWAWRQWEGVCGIEPEYTEEFRLAHAVINCGAVDNKRGGMIAIADMPDGETMLKRFLRCDDMEDWVFKHGKHRKGVIDLGRTFTHEIGHLIGIPHLETGAIMQPMYDVGVWRLAQADVREAQVRYGLPKKSSRDKQCLELPPSWKITIEPDEFGRPIVSTSGA